MNFILFYTAKNGDYSYKFFESADDVITFIRSGDFTVILGLKELV